MNETAKERLGYLIGMVVSLGSAFLLSPVWGGRVLFWIALVAGILFLLMIIGAGKQAGKGETRRESCRMCRREILPEGTVLGLQNMFLAQNNPAAAARIEGQSGYYCSACGKKYCKGCLESRAPSHANGGKACPACGGSFAIMR